MSTRLDRYMCAVQLAQLILEGNPRHDALRLQQAVDDLEDELKAGRKNQRSFRRHAERAQQLLEEAGYSVKAPLRLVGREENR